MRNTTSIVVALLITVATSASVHGQVLKDDQKCIAGLNRSGAKLFVTQVKENERCVKLRGKGKLVGTVDACIAADTNGKVQSASEKVTSAHEKCVAPPPFGATDAPTVVAAAIEKPSDHFADLFGSPADPAVVDGGVDSDAARCQASVSTSYVQLAKVVLKLFVKCKTTGLADGSITDQTGIEDCQFDDPLGGVGKVWSKWKQFSADACEGTDLDLAFPGVCLGAPDFVAFDTCITARAKCHLCLYMNAADGIAADCDLLDDMSDNESCSEA
jgi:hypothetical protein